MENRKRIPVCELIQTPHTRSCTSKCLCLSDRTYKERKRPFRYDHITQCRRRARSIDLWNMHALSNVWGRKSLFNSQLSSLHI